eukprot:111281_1
MKSSKQSCNSPRTSPPRKHASPQHLPVDDDPSQSQLAMNKVVRKLKKRKVKSDKVHRVKPMSPLPRPKRPKSDELTNYKRKPHHQTPERVLVRSRHHHHTHVPLSPYDREVYGGPLPYFVKMPIRAKQGATLNPIAPAQSKDSYEANVAFNEWFAGDSQSNLVIETQAMSSRNKNRCVGDCKELRKRNEQLCEDALSHDNDLKKLEMENNRLNADLQALQLEVQRLRNG